MSHLQKMQSLVLTQMHFRSPGSCYCHPEPSDAQMPTTLRWALARASIQTEPLLVTLLLPKRRNLHSQACSATPASYILSMYRTYRSQIPRLGQAKLIILEPLGLVQTSSYWAPSKAMTPTIQLTGLLLQTLSHPQSKRWALLQGLHVQE